MQQYRELLPTLEQLAKEAYDLLRRALREKHIYVTAFEYRVKTEQSLAGKLELKGAKYKTITDVTDLVGLRVITFYTDEVDKVAAIAKRVFDIDWQESVDKRKLHHLDSFGYNSLHYICRLKEEGETKKEQGIRFELQMRTALQHVWSTIEHDTGYKGDVKIPKEYKRQFSRLAGMLELVDDEFSRLRTELTDYRRQIQGMVKSGQLDDVPLSTDSFRSFLELNPFDRLNKRIAAVNQAEIYPVSLMPYLPVLESFGVECSPAVSLPRACTEAQRRVQRPEVRLRHHQRQGRCQRYAGRHDTGTGQDAGVYAEEKVKTDIQHEEGEDN